VNPNDWKDEIFIGNQLPPGYRLHILGKDESETVDPKIHFSGDHLEGDFDHVLCPNCSRPLFPIFKLDLRDKRVRDLGLWAKEYLQVLVCPSCAFYTKPYWIRFHSGVIEVRGGRRDDGKILQDIVTPYESRVIKLESLVAEDYPLSKQSVLAFHTRTRPPGVYHQIGGLPKTRGYDEMNCCDCGKSMRFAGIVDYDDLNAPLYEKYDNGHQEPVALVIGDMDSLHYFTCPECAVIGIKWKTL
jgi:hypothetical protein